MLFNCSRHRLTCFLILFSLCGNCFAFLNKTSFMLMRTKTTLGVGTNNKMRYVKNFAPQGLESSLPAVLLCGNNRVFANKEFHDSNMNLDLSWLPLKTILHILALSLHNKRLEQIYPEARLLPLQKQMPLYSLWYISLSVVFSVIVPKM